MHINVSAGAEVAIVGATIAGCGSQRQYAVTEAEIRLNLDTTRDLHLALHPDVAKYRYDSGTIEILIPLLSREWIRTPVKLDAHPLLTKACETGSIKVRIVTPTEERTFVAAHMQSDRWLADLSWSTPSARDRVLIQIGRDGVPSSHPKATRVQTVEDDPEEYFIHLGDLVLPARTTCIFCDSPKPDTREHALPSWATPPGGMGITVACCGSCNNALSFLESAVADIHRSKPSSLGNSERLLVGSWAIKTIWAIGKALDYDPLKGAGTTHLSRFIPAITSGPSDPEYVVSEVYSSVESVSYNYIKFSADPSHTKWAMLHIMGIVTSVRIIPLGSDAGDPSSQVD